MAAAAAMCLTLLSCGEPPIVQQPDPQADIKENLINANKYISDSEETQIDEYVKRRGWKMQRINCGARIDEYQTTGGAALQWEEQVVVDYRLEALNGRVFYEQRTDTLTVGKQQPNIGLDASLLRLHHGSRARVIVPSNEGFGVVGDGERVKSRVVLVYDVAVK